MERKAQRLTHTCDLFLENGAYWLKFLEEQQPSLSSKRALKLLLSFHLNMFCVLSAYMSLDAISFVADLFQCAFAERVPLLVQQESEDPAEEVEGYDDDEESAPSRKKAKVASQDTPMKSPSKPVDKVYSKKKSHEEEPKVTPAKKGPGRPKKSLEDSGKKDSTKVKKATPKKSTSATKEKGTSH